MTEKIWLLKQCDLFGKLTPDELRHLEGVSRVRRFARKNPIYLPADYGQSVLLLVSGRAKLCSFTPEGKQAILAFIEPGELFGELALFEDGSRDEYAEAVEPSVVVLIPHEAIQRLMETRPEIALGVTKLIGLRRRRIERRLKYLLFRSNRERLVNLLLELAEDYGKQTSEGIELSIRLSHQDLANVIGSTRESVTMLLGELQSAKLVRLGRRRVVLLDMAGLAAAAESRLPALPSSRVGGDG